MQLFYGDDMIVLCVADLDELDTLDASFYTLKQLGLRADLCTIKLLLVGHVEDPQSVAIMLATAMLSKGTCFFNQGMPLGASCKAKQLRWGNKQICGEIGGMEQT